MKKYNQRGERDINNKSQNNKTLIKKLNELSMNNIPSNPVLAVQLKMIILSVFQNILSSLTTNIKK